jgi:hypothetical protein
MRVAPTTIGKLAGWSLLALSLNACSARVNRTTQAARPCSPLAPPATEPRAVPAGCPEFPRVEERATEGVESAENPEVADVPETESASDPAWEAEWRWVKQHFPDAATYEPPSGLLARLLGWAKPGETILVYDRRCRPAPVTRRPDSLYGIVHRGFHVVPSVPEEMSESISEIRIGQRFDEFPSSAFHYERDSNGLWVNAGSSGFGDVREVEHMLSAVTNEAAWFGDAAVSLRIACSRMLQEESRCTSGDQRTCQRCEAWGAFPTSQESRYGGHRQVATRRVKATSADCRAPCPAPAEPAEVTRANEALRERPFRMRIHGTSKPLVFRTEAACRQYAKGHAFTADELDVWRAHDPE